MGFSAQKPHVLNNLLPATSLPNIIYFKDAHVPVFNDAMKTVVKCTVVLITTWQELNQCLSNGDNIITVHISTIENSGSTISEFINMIESMSKFLPYKHKLKIGVVIRKDTDVKVIKELKKNNITGLLLDCTDFPISDVIAGLHSFIDNIQYWPIHIIHQLKKYKHQKSVEKFQLTDRQYQVLSLICNRGLSNKQIAKTLSIAESTVKIHVSAIMKVYAVKNRTQLVLAFSSKLRA